MSPLTAPFDPPALESGTLRITPLGGLGEVGRNMTVFEYGGKLLVVDCGVLFPEEHQPGVDLILPDFGPIRDRLDDVLGVVLTHGHEDHIGAVPYLLKLKGDIPLIGSTLTIATGFIDWLTISWWTPLWKTATLHALAMAAASIFFAIALGIGHGDYVDGRVSTASLVLTLIGFVMVTTGGWLGGAVTYVHGMRVLGLPDEPTERAVTPVPHDEKVRAA